MSLFTQTVGSNSGSNKENLLFLYVKQVPDYYPFENIYWYPQAGKNGYAKTVWPALSIKNWVGCGKDEVIKQWIDSMLTDKSFISSDGLKHELMIPDYERIATKTDPQKQRTDTTCEHIKTEHNHLIPPSFNHKENLDLLCGYQSSTANLSVLQPFGFFDQDFIYDHLNRDIWGVIEHRSSHLTFQPVQDSASKPQESKKVQGFYQQTFVDGCTYMVHIYNEDDKEIGQGKIDSKSGYFSSETSEPVSQGVAKVFRNDHMEKKIDFVFIRDVDFKIHMSTTTYKDAFGQDHMITKKELRPKVLEPISWYRKSFASEIEADKKLSTHFKSLFDYLGPRVLIVDPYFLGHIEKDVGPIKFMPKPDMTSFLNALVHSSLDYGFEQVDILGCGRASDSPDATASDGLSKMNSLLANYKDYFKAFITNNRFEKLLGGKAINFHLSNEKFHSRYWFSQIEKSGILVLDKCVIVTNSFGNLDAVDIMPVSNRAQLRRLQLQFSTIYEKSEKRISVI